MNINQCTELERRTKNKAAAEPAKPRSEEPRNLFGLTRETTDMLCTVTDALREFPEARTAVAAALKRAREAREAAARVRQ